MCRIVHRVCTVSSQRNGMATRASPTVLERLWAHGTLAPRKQPLFATSRGQPCLSPGCSLRWNKTWLRFSHVHESSTVRYPVFIHYRHDHRLGSDQTCVKTRIRDLRGRMFLVHGGGLSACSR